MMQPIVVEKAKDFFGRRDEILRHTLAGEGITQGMDQGLDAFINQFGMGAKNHFSSAPTIL